MTSRKELARQRKEIFLVAQNVFTLFRYFSSRRPRTLGEITTRLKAVWGKENEILALAPSAVTWVVEILLAGEQAGMVERLAGDPLRFRIKRKCFRLMSRDISIQISKLKGQQNTLRKARVRLL